LEVDKPDIAILYENVGKWPIFDQTPIFLTQKANFLSGNLCGSHSTAREEAFDRSHAIFGLQAIGNIANFRQNIDFL